jgi:putative flavoprotein involved in K+ transport
MAAATSTCANFDAADASYNNICAMIDKYIAANQIVAPDGDRTIPCWRPDWPARELNPVGQRITSIVWSTGSRADWSRVDLPIFDGAGYPNHTRGVTSSPGVYVLGLPWLYSWGSGRFVGVVRDAGYLAERITSHLATRELVAS